MEDTGAPGSKRGGRTEECPPLAVPLHRLWGSVTDSLPMSVIGGYYHLDADETQRVVAD